MKKPLLVAIIAITPAFCLAGEYDLSGLHCVKNNISGSGVSYGLEVKDNAGEEALIQIGKKYCFNTAGSPHGAALPALIQDRFEVTHTDPNGASKSCPLSDGDTGKPYWIVDTSNNQNKMFCDPMVDEGSAPDFFDITVSGSQIPLTLQDFSITAD